MKNLFTNSRTRWLGMVICTCMLLLWNAHAYATDLYVRGERNSWGTSEKMDGTSSPWTYVSYWSNSDNKTFKIADASWSNDYNFGGATISAFGTKYNLTKQGNNMTFPTVPTGGGVYKITVTLESGIYKIQVDKLLEEQSDWKDIMAPKIYWDNTAANYSNVSMLNGRYTNYGGQGAGSGAYSLTHITNTNLWYTTDISNASGDASKFTTSVFINDSWSGWESSLASERAAKYATNYTASNCISLNSDTYLFNAASGSNNATLTGTKKTGGWSDLNYTQTLNQELSTDGGSSYSASTLSLATVSVSAYKLKNATTAESSSGTIAAASSSTSCVAAHNNTVTYTVSSVATGYTFVGWYEGVAQKSTSTTYTYRATAAKTVKARFKENQYTVSRYASGSVTGGSFTAASPAGQITGGNVTATPSTGYHFSSWSVTSGTGSFGSTTTASTKFYPTSNATVKATFAPNTYDITLDKNGGDSDGSATATYLDDDLASFSGASRTGYTCDGYFDDPDDGEGNMIIDASGNLQLSQTGYTNASGWSKTTTPTTLYAHWTENVSNYTVTYGVKSDQTSLGTLSCATTVGGSSIDSGDEVAGGTGITFTAAPISGYEVDAWCSNAACTKPIAGAGYANTYALSLSQDTTVYVKFKKKIYTITYSPSSAPTGCTYTTKPANGTYGNTVTMVFTPSTGYTVSVSARDASSNVVAISNPSANTYTFTQPASAVTVTVTATEQKKTLTPTVDYNGGATPATPYTASSSNTVGVATTTDLSCSEPNAAHYTFAGWTLENLTVTDGDASTDREITVKITDYSQAISAVAEYEEVLTTSYELRGGSAFGTHPTNPWDNVHALTKKSGHSTESVAYYTASIASTNTGSANGDFQFKIKNGDTWYGIEDSGDQWWYTRAISEGGSKTQTLSSSGKNIELRADIAGDYEIKVDYSSTPTITITFPTTYTLTYDIGTVKGNNGSISTSPTTASGSKVLSGTNITLTAPAAKAGYSWKGWYTNAAGTEGKIADVSRAITVTMDADKTLYACYTEDMHDVTVNVTGSGTVSYGAGAAGSSCTASAGIATASNTIHAIPAAGYAFVGWTGVSAEEDNHITNYTATWNSTNEGWDLTVKADAATTITANFAPRFALVGAINTGGNPEGGMPGWDLEDAAAFTYSAGTYTITPTLTSSNTTYVFKIIDRRAESWIWRGYSEASNNLPVDNTTTYTLTANGGNNVYFDTRAAGDYTFTVVEETQTGVKYPKVKIACPTSYLITSGVKTFYNDDASSDATETGGTFTAVDNSSNNVKGGKYVASGASVTFTAKPNAGYQFDAWYTDAACTAGRTTTNPLTVSSISANVTRYAKFKEIMVAIDINTHGYGTISIDDGDPVEETDGSTVPFIKVGVHTTHKVTIVSEDEGYYFAGWELSAGSSCVAADKAVNFTISGTASDEDNRTNVTITGLGDPDKCTSLNFLEAKFGELEKIHFRNNFDDGTNPATHWSNVYVYFDVDLQDSRVKTSEYNTSKNLHVAMTNSEYKNRWWAYVPRYITKNNKYKVAFADFDYAENGYKLWPGSGSSNHAHAVYRDDYRSNNNLFVPYHVPTSTNTSDVSGNVDYYNDGYWMLYTIYTGVGGGYYVEERTGSGTYSGRLGELDVINKAWETQKIQYSLRVDGLSHNKFVIFNEAGHKYKASSDITYANCTDVIMIEDNNADAYFNFTPTAEGQYVITIEQEGDQMKMSVEYPVVAGDYVIENAYNDGSAKTTRSNVIKASSASTKTRYSMYLNNAGSGTLKLRKCESINASGVPQWSDGDDTYLQDILDDAKFTKGVYQFDVAVNTSTHKVSEIDSVRLYTGNYYIKTDAASGGWAAYKQNAMDKNTVNFDRTSATYDNYMCKYFASKDCNIKSVIANDYCNQLSDTVKDDGIARMYKGEPYVPTDGTSIRFSYNSATNETKRAYLGASERNDFLNIYPSTDNKIYRTVDANEYDLYDIRTSDKGKCKFADNGNWVYEMDLKVYPSGKAGVNATYTDASSVAHVQTLIPDTNTILGGSSSSTNPYSIRIVYDFKTNYMMSSFILDGSTISEDLSDFDMLWVRHKDESATQLILGVDKKLTNVRPIGAIEFRYDSVNYYASHTGHWQDVSSWNYPGARPYLKYFVSFPFDVQVSSIFGLNKASYGRYGDYVIQKYNGAKRAKEGLFYGDGDNYWEDVEMGDTLHANEGYCVIFDNEYVGGWKGQMWENKAAGSRVYLYFPAMKEVATITNSEQAVTVAPHTCTINRTYTVGGKEKNHMETDSHWSMIGLPLYHDSYIKSFVNGETLHKDSTLKSYYYMDLTSSFANQDWKSMAITTGSTEFPAMSCVLVQWYGTITWTTSAGPYAAPRKTNDIKNYLAQLDLWYNGGNADQTFISLVEDGDADFVLRDDMCKVVVKARPNIYTFAGDYDVAYNEMPLENCTIPVGVVARKNGTYTFSMPSNFSGTVTLIDKFEQTRTNLALEDYEVYLEKGTIDDRFEVEININDAPTAIDGAADGEGTLRDGKAHKFIMNDMMYIIKDGVIYDARGQRVQ